MGSMSAFLPNLKWNLMSESLESWIGIFRNCREIINRLRFVNSAPSGNAQLTLEVYSKESKKINGDLEQNISSIRWYYDITFSDNIEKCIEFDILTIPKAKRQATKGKSNFINIFMIDIVPHNYKWAF